MTSEKGLEIIKHGWAAAWILEAIELGSVTLLSIELLDYSDPVLSTQVLEDYCNILGVDEFTVNNNRKVDKDDENDHERRTLWCAKKRNIWFLKSLIDDNLLRNLNFFDI